MTASHHENLPPCPSWCAMRHGQHAGEEDQIHVSSSIFVHNSMVRMCMTTDPVTGMQDGPYVLIGSDEYTLAETSTLVDVLSSLLTQAEDATPHAGA